MTSKLNIFVEYFSFVTKGIPNGLVGEQKFYHFLTNFVSTLFLLLIINPLHATGLFQNLLKNKKTSGFPMFSGSIKKDQWYKMD